MPRHGPRGISGANDRKTAEKIMNRILTKEMTESDMCDRDEYSPETLLADGEIVTPLGCSYYAHPELVTVDLSGRNHSPQSSIAQAGGSHNSSSSRSYHDAHSEIAMKPEASHTDPRNRNAHQPTKRNPPVPADFDDDDDDVGVKVIERKITSRAGNKSGANSSASPTSSASGFVTPPTHFSSYNSANEKKEKAAIVQPTKTPFEDSGSETELDLNIESPVGSPNLRDQFSTVVGHDKENCRVGPSKSGSMNNESSPPSVNPFPIKKQEPSAGSKNNVLKNTYNEGASTSAGPNVAPLADRVQENKNHFARDGFGFAAYDGVDINDILKMDFGGFEIGLKNYKRADTQNRPFRKQKQLRKELNPDELENTKRVMNEWEEHIKKKENDPNFVSDLEARTETLKMLKKNRNAGMEVVPEDSSVTEMEQFNKEISKPCTLKYFDQDVDGFVVIQEKRTEEELIKIRKSNLEILEFVYERSADSSLSNVDLKALENVRSALNHGDMSLYRDGDVSVVIDLHTYDANSFPPNFTTRRLNDKNVGRLLRPVMIDGVAIQYVSKGFAVRHSKSYRPFFSGQNTEKKLYSHEMTINVRPVVEVALNFLFRGHKTTIYYPKYYEKYVTKGGISKVDDVFAFRTLLECGLIEFVEVGDTDMRSQQEKPRTWFHTLQRKSEHNKAVLVSTDLYNSTLNTNCKYEKVSDRILTPTYLNTPDRIMVIEPTIRYIAVPPKTYKTIKAEDILYFRDNDSNEPHMMEKQLFLGEQINQICHLCQLYPLNISEKMCVKEILLLIVQSRSNIVMPYMSEENYYELRSIAG